MEPAMKEKYRQTGFSLVEVLIVIGIFSILAAAFISLGFYTLARKNTGLETITRLKGDLLLKRNAALLGVADTTNRTFNSSTFVLPPNTSFRTPARSLPFPGSVLNSQQIGFESGTGKTESKTSGWLVIESSDGTQFGLYVPYVAGFAPVYRLRQGGETWEPTGVNK
jgi:prepilin-type N-terminal cleavage/methylation domain-containing protein